MFLLAVLAAAAQAKPPADEPCQYSVSRQIPFAAPTAQDRLTVSIGPGPCYLARLTITVTSDQGKLLYSYTSPLSPHIDMDIKHPELAKEARRFADDTVTYTLVRKNDRPVPKARPVAEEGDPIFKVPLDIYKRLMARGQPMLYHSTYYEGGQYVVFDPEIGKARVVAEAGL